MRIVKELSTEHTDSNRKIQNQYVIVEVFAVYVFIQFQLITNMSGSWKYPMAVRELHASTSEEEIIDYFNKAMTWLERE